MRKALSLIALIPVLLFAACETDPATDVTYKSATLHGQTRCQQSPPVYDSSVQFELRREGGEFEPVGPVHSYHCENEPGVKKPIADTPVTDLRQDSHYEYRLRNLDNDSTYDQDGTENGTNYESFDTPAFQTVTPRPADAIRKTIGINTRLPYQGTPHANCAKVKEAIQYTGVYETRDGLWPSYDPQWPCLRDLVVNTDVKLVVGLGNLLVASKLVGCNPPDGLPTRLPTAAELTADACVAWNSSDGQVHWSAGRSDVREFTPNKPGNGEQCLNCKLYDLDNGTTTNPTLNHGIRSRIIAFENVNEPDLYTVFTNWQEVTQDYQEWLWSLKQRPGYEHVKVLGPSFALGGYNEPAFKDGDALAPFMDQCVMHPYPGDGVPPASIISNSPNCEGIAAGKQKGVTEVGWHGELCGVDQDGDGNNAEAGECRYNKGVSESVVASYTLRGILENYRLALGRTDWYTIVQQWANPLNDGWLGSADWGWYNYDWSPRQVAHTVHRFTETIGTGSAQTPLPYRVDSATADTRSFVFRRDDGKYVVALWRTPSQWNQGPVGVPGTPASVGVVGWSATIPDAASVSYVVPTTGQTGPLAKNDDQYQMILGGDPVLVVIEPLP